MSKLLHLMPASSHAGQIQQGYVLGVVDGADVTVRLAGTSQIIDCQVLYTGTVGLAVSEDDPVLVWVQDAPAKHGIILGRIGPYTEATRPVVSRAEFATWPETQVIEAQGDLVLRNGQAKIKLGAKGDVEILCSSFTTRSRQLARLLAPLIKFN